MTGFVTGCYELRRVFKFLPINCELIGKNLKMA